MSFLSSVEPEPTRRGPIVVIVVLVLLVAGVTTWMLRRPTPVPTPRPSPPSTPRPTRSALPTPTPEHLPSLRPHAAPTPRPALLHVESDLPGAQVFLDRKYVGTTPVDLCEVAPGPHQLNVSVEGYDPHTEPVELGVEPVRVTVRFREVRLEESLPIVHKHGVGSCRGALVATTDGLTFAPTSGAHAFRTSFDAVEKFEVDYLKKNLRLTLRGGRTYNFTVDGPSADPLLVFQKKVDAARARLASAS